MANLSVSLLGTFTVILASRPVTQFGANKVRALLAYLMVEHDRAHPREALAGLLWPDMPETAARHNLSQSLHRLRTALDDSQAQVPFILADRHSIQFNPLSDCLLDVVEFEELCRNVFEAIGTPLPTAEPLPAASIQSLVKAAELYRGDFLVQFSIPDSDLFDDWMRLKRAQLRQQAFTVLEFLVTHFDAGGEYESAQKFGRQLVALDEFHENAHRRLMRLLALSGHRDAALRHFDHVRHVWAEEFGVDLEGETLALADQIRNGGFDRPSEWQTTSPAISPPTSVQIAEGRPSLSSYQDWGDAPYAGTVYGRDSEFALLNQWIEGEGCRLVTIYGIGGQGKTTVAARLARNLAHNFDFVIWRSLLNAPPLAEIMQVWLRILAAESPIDQPESLDEQANLLFDLLNRHRCLFVLDNLESLMNESGRAGEYQNNFSGYDQLVRWFGEREHQSCLLLTSREIPRQFVQLEREGTHVRSLQLRGVEAQTGQAILEDAGVHGSPEEIAELINRYSGNPLALILVADTVHELFDADITAFLCTESAVFDDIQDVLDQEFRRLSPLELSIMYWLAIEREPVPLSTLTVDLLHASTPGALLAALRSLQRRALLEKREQGFATQDVVMGYTTQRITAQFCQEIEDEQQDSIARYALIKAHSPDYVRLAQERVLLSPVAEWLLNRHGRVGTAHRLQRMLNNVQANPAQGRGYAAGNILNLLLYLGIDCHGWNFSGLTIRQAYTRGSILAGIDFRRADLGESVFSDAFSHILCVAFSPDGHLVAARTGDEEVRIWEMPVGRLHTVFKQETNAVWPVHFTPDGTALISGRSGTEVCIWDLQTKQVRHILHGHTHRIWTMAVSARQGVLATAGEDLSVHLWDVHSGRLLATFTGHTQTVRAVAFSPDGRTLASGSEDGTILLLDVPSGDLIHALTNDRRRVFALAFSPDGQALASGDEDGVIHLWDLSSLREDGTVPTLRFTLSGHTDAVQSLQYEPGGNTVASSSWDGTVRLWCSHSGQSHQILRGHSRQVPSIAFHPNGRSLVSGGWDKTVRVWDTRSGMLLLNLIGHKRGICQLVFSDDGHTLVSESEDRRLCWWETASLLKEKGDILPSAQSGPALLLTSFTNRPFRWRQMAAADARRVHFWNTDGRRFQFQEWLYPRLHRACISPDGQTMAEITRDHEVVFRSRETGEIIHCLEGHTDSILAIAFSPDGASLASGSEDHAVRIWDVQTGQLQHTLAEHRAGIWDVVFSPDGKLLASSGGQDQTICLWDTDSGNKIFEMRGHTDSVFSLAFSPDARHLASGSEDHTIRIWDLSNGEAIHLLQAHTNAVWSVLFTPDGHSLVSGSADESIRIWDVKTGNVLTALHPPGPYDGMQIGGVQGLTPTQHATLKALGAVDK